MIKAYYFILNLIILFSCQQQAAEIINSEKLKELQSEGVAVIDIRTTGEFSQGHIPGAIHIDFRSPSFKEKMSAYQSEKVIIHCASGGRSSRAMSMLKESGFTEIYDYSGGFVDWKRRGEKVAYD